MMAEKNEDTKMYTNKMRCVSKGHDDPPCAINSGLIFMNGMVNANQLASQGARQSTTTYLPSAMLAASNASGSVLRKSSRTPAPSQTSIIYPPKGIVADDGVQGTVHRAPRRAAQKVVDLSTVSNEERLRAEYNSTLLYLNSHLRGTPWYSRLPFLQNVEENVIPFLPKGTPLPHVHRAAGPSRSSIASRTTGGCAGDCDESSTRYDEEERSSSSPQPAGFLDKFMRNICPCLTKKRPILLPEGGQRLSTCDHQCSCQQNSFSYGHDNCSVAETLNETFNHALQNF